MESYQDEANKTYLINATSTQEAIESAICFSQYENISSTKTTCFESDHFGIYPDLPKQYLNPIKDTEEDPTLKGYKVDVVKWTRFGGGQYETGSIVTNIEINEKPFFSPHNESSTDPFVFTIPIRVEQTKENTLFLNNASMINEIQTILNCEHIEQEKIQSLIKNSFTHESINSLMIDNNLIGTFVEYLRSSHKYLPLAVFNKQTKSFILNDALINEEPSIYEPIVQKITTEITEQLLQENISNKSKKKNITKV